MNLENIENISSLGLTVGSGFLVGILIGYALKKVVRLVAIVVGLFLTGLAYLQYQQIVTINWDKIPKISESCYNAYRHNNKDSWTCCKSHFRSRNIRPWYTINWAVLLPDSQ